MTFLNPFVLIGLMAGAIPVILHLLNLRKVRTIEFSTIAFLKELQQTKLRRLKLRQILLLIIRTLIIIFIILAFARPVFRGTLPGGLGTHARTSVVYILDDSFSMMASDEHGERYEQAKETAGKLTDMLKEGDEVYLIKLSDLPRATVESGSHDFEEVRAIIAGGSASYIRRPLSDAFSIASQLLRRSTNANKEIYLISDMQRTLFSETGGENGMDAIPLFDAITNVFLVPIGGGNAGNTSIDSVAVTTTLLEKDKPTIISAVIRNYNPAPLRNYVVSAYIDGMKVAQRSVNIEPMSSVRAELILTPKRTGNVKGFVELENDAINEDNRRYFTLRIPARVQVLIIANSDEDARFIKFALQSTGNDSGRSLLEVRQSVPQKFPSSDLTKTDVLLISNIKSFTENDAERIKSFLGDGGGLVLFPGDNIDIAGYNRGLLSTLSIPGIERETSDTIQNADLSFGKIDFDHPLFSTVFEKEEIRNKPENRTIESPQINKRIRRETGKEGTTIIAMNDGKPFLSEHSFTNGKILIYSVAANLSWSDFPMKGLFAPLIYRSVFYAALRTEDDRSYYTGDEPILRLKIPADKQNRSCSVVSPDGTEELIHLSKELRRRNGHGPSAMLHLRRLNSPGFYEVRSGQDPLSVFAVNPDPLEADTRTASEIEQVKIIGEWGLPQKTIHRLMPDERMHASILQTRFGIELWQYCVLLALMMTIGEMLIARDTKKGV